jgi:hypothetical protein
MTILRGLRPQLRASYPLNFIVEQVEQFAVGFPTRTTASGREVVNYHITEKDWLFPPRANLSLY